VKEQQSEVKATKRQMHFKAMKRKNNTRRWIRQRERATVGGESNRETNAFESDEAKEQQSEIKRQRESECGVGRDRKSNSRKWKPQREEQEESAEKPNVFESDKVKYQQSEVKTTFLPSYSLSSDYPKDLALGGSTSSSDYLPSDSPTEQLDQEMLSQQLLFQSLGTVRFDVKNNSSSDYSKSDSFTEQNYLPSNSRGSHSPRDSPRAFSLASSF
jgi:hypothetical protein